MSLQTRSRRVTAASAVGLLGSSFAVLAALSGTATAAPIETQAKLSHSEAMSQLKDAGITRSSSGNCSDRNTPTCTSLEQVRQTTISGVITLKKASGCAINVTGGTEVGHADGTYSHYNGYKVDISKSGCVDGYVKSAFTRIGDRGDGYPQWQAASGNIYCDEGNHWDILYTSAG